MNLKKCLAILLTLTLTITCVVSGMSLTTTAANEDAVTALKTAWGKMTYPTEVLFDTFYYGDGTGSNPWSNCTTSTGTLTKIDVGGQEIDINAYTYPADSKTKIISQPQTGNPTHRPIDYSDSIITITDYASIYVYYKVAADSSASLVGTGSTPSYFTFGKTEEWTKKEIVSSTSIKELDGKMLWRLQTAASGISLSQVYGCKKVAMPETDDLAALITAANKLDLTTVNDDTAKADFIKALAAAKKVLLTNDAAAKAYISGVWSALTHTDAPVLDVFYDKSSGNWGVSPITPTVIDGITYAVPTAVKDGQFIVMGAFNGNVSVGEPEVLVDVDNYEKLYFNYQASAQANMQIGWDQKNGDGVKADYNPNLPATTGIETYDLLTLLTDSVRKANYDGTTGSFCRIHFSGTANKINYVSYIYGVKKMNLVTEFPDLFDASGAKDLSLAKWIDAYTKQDFSAYEGAEALAAAINDVCSVKPKYAAFKSVATSANDLSTIQRLDCFENGNSGALAATVTEYTTAQTAKDAENADIQVPLCPDYTVGRMYHVSFPGVGFSNLGTKNHTSMAYIKDVAFQQYNLAHKTATDVYLSYFIPSSVKSTVKIGIAPRGSTTTITNTDAVQYIKTVELTERDKWVQLTTEDLLANGIKVAELTVSNRIIYQLCTDDGETAEVYLSFMVWGKQNTYTASSLYEYYEAYNEVEVGSTDVGKRFVKNNSFDFDRKNYVAAISGHKIDNVAVLNNKGNVYYNEGGVDYTAYRVFANYTCPNDANGDAQLDMIKIGDDKFTIDSRSIMLLPQTNDAITAENAAEKGAVVSNSSGDALKNIYWSVTDNGDGTSNVVYSIYLKKINQDKAENRKYTSRALITYGGGKQLYTPQTTLVTVKESWEKAGEPTNWFGNANA